MSDYDDIRPYHDDEVRQVLQRVIADDEFIDLAGQLRFSRWYTNFRWMMRPIVRRFFQHRSARIHSVQDLQGIVEQYMARMIEQTTSGFTVSGLDAVDLSQPHVFMSNHRDITLDPAFTNYALYHKGGATLRIAIGDNLLSKPYAADLMRLNKSFVVQRSISKPRELLRALKKLSGYIWHSLHSDKENIWLAHREGRAKDGMDRTEPAIIKMLAIAKPKAVSLSDYINDLSIVPVSISYEFDPCDAIKAKEIRMLSEKQAYAKSEHEDLASIGLGIQGFNGQVNLVFGKPLVVTTNNAEEIARQLDEQIVRNYQLQPTNVIAYLNLYGEHAWAKAQAVLEASERHHVIPGVDATTQATFVARMEAIDPVDRNMALHMYANPVLHKLYFLDATEYPLPNGYGAAQGAVGTSTVDTPAVDAQVVDAQVKVQ